ncbi:hypothetical protein NCW_00211 [Burkholderia pseudomallei]
MATPKIRAHRKSGTPKIQFSDPKYVKGEREKQSQETKLFLRFLRQRDVGGVR